MKTLPLIPLMAAMSAHASIVSWNVDQFGTVSGSAGVEPAANWTNTVPAGGNPFVARMLTDLPDDTGAATTLDISYGAWGAWRIQASHPGADGDGSNNKELLNGYLNAGPAAWNPSVTASTVALSQIPYPKYKVIVYFSSDAADREGTVSDGTTTCYFKTTGAAGIAGADAALVRATATTEDGYAVGANYAVFEGLTGSSRTLTVQMRDNDEWGGIAGFQIVADLGTLPEFAVHPDDQAVAIGALATFNAAAAADPAPTYQWEFSPTGTGGWTTLDGQVMPQLLFTVTAAEEGHYRVVATNSNGSAASDAAFLDAFFASPAILIQPAANTYAVEGSEVTMAVEAAGYDELSFQWFRDGEALAGEASNTLVLAAVGMADDGVYTVRIRDSVEAGLETISREARVATFPAWDGLVSHEDFDTAAGYTIGRLPAQQPAVAGYSGTWTDIDFGNAEPEILAGPLVYGDPLYLGSTGDHAGKAADADGITTANSGRVYRRLAPVLAVAPNTTGVRYVSWLYRNGGGNAAANATTHSVLSLYQDSGGAEPSGDAARRVFEAGISDADFGNTNFGFRLNDAIMGDLGVPLDGGVHLFVAKFELSAEPGSDSVTVWMDPPLAAGDPAAGGVTVSGLDLAFDSLALSDYASNAAAWDEIRWGSSFGSVSLGTSTSGSFAEWIAGYPGVGALNSFDDDPDHDGVPNGVESVFGTSPVVRGTGLTQVASGAGNTLKFQHPANGTPPSDVAASYVWSTDLATWQESGASSGGTAVSFSAVPNSPAPGVTTVTATISGAAPSKVFSRLRAVRTP